MTEMTTRPAKAGGPAPELTAAARAYLRLLAAVRAVLDDPPHDAPATVLLAEPIAEADAALCSARIGGNERDFLRLVARQALLDDPRGPAAPDPGP